MRNLNEYKAEILARSEKRIKKRRERRIRTVAVVLPISVAVVFASFFLIPEMLFVGFDKAENEAAGTAEKADGVGNIQLLKFTSFSVSCGSEESSVTDADRVADTYFAVRDAFSADGGTLENDHDDKANDSNFEVEGINGYTVRFNAANGENENYKIFENKLYSLNSGAVTVLTEEQQNELYTLLGIRE